MRVPDQSDSWGNMLCYLGGATLHVQGPGGEARDPYPVESLFDRLKTHNGAAVHSSPLPQTVTLHVQTEPTPNCRLW